MDSSQVMLSRETLAGPDFIEHQFKHGLGWVSGISVVDLDGDGDLDVLAASPVTDTIVWFENDGRQRFFGHVADNSFPGVTCVRAADLDGDEDEDIVASAEGGQALGWWENDGSENFVRHVIDALFEFLEDGIALADLDNDGDTDILGGSYNAGLAWWENDRKGHFVRHLLPGDSKLSSVTVGDIDADGWQDIVFSSDGGIHWRKNLQNRSFSDTFGTTYTEGAWYPQVIDVDRDGDNDIVSSGGGVSVLENLGRDQWGYWQFRQLVIAESFDESTAPWAGDFDDDGDVDIVCGSGKSGPYGLERICWWENKGAWSFTEHVVAENAGAVSALSVADVGNDGDIDLFSITLRGETIGFYEKNPQADPEPPNDASDLRAVGPPQDQRIELAWLDPVDSDLNKILLVRSLDAEIPAAETGHVYPDGQDTGPAGLWCRNVDRGWEGYIDEDVAPEQTYYYKVFAYDNAANYSSGLVVSCESDPDTIPPPPPEYFMITAHQRPTDFQANWKVPVGPETMGFLIVRSEKDEFVPPTNGTIYESGEGNGPGGLWCDSYDVNPWSAGQSVGQGVYVPDPGKAYYYAFYARDQYYNYSTPVTDSTAPGPFPLRFMATVENDDHSPYFLFVSDLDADGDGDLLTCPGSAGRGIYLWENKGAEGFALRQIRDPRGPKIYLGDMDGDGDEDVLYAGESQYPEVAWIRNDGNLRFTETHIIDPDFSPLAICVADVDGDSDADVLATTGYPETLILWKNEDEMGFARNTLHDGVTASLLKSGDVDGDGDADVLSFGPSGLVWWINSGDAMFSPVRVDEECIAVYSFDVGDLDGDCDTDFVIANQMGDVVWYENWGELHFDRHSVGSCPEGWVDVFVCDLDGDGRTDIFCKTWARVISWRNDGAQNFSMSIFDRHGVRSRSLSFFDMDRDGDLDVVGYLGEDLGVRLWENTLPLDDQAPSPVEELMTMPGTVGGVFIVWHALYQSDLRGVLLLRNTEDSFPTPERLVSYRDGDDTGPGGLWCRTFPKCSNSYEDNQVAENTEYFYAAYAFDEVPNYSRGIFLRAMTESDFTPPAEPTDVNVSVAFNDVVITWTDPTEADFESVLVVRSTSGTLPWVPAGERYSDGDASGPEGLWCRNIRKGERMCVDATADTGTTYWYAVYAYDEIPNYSQPVAVPVAVRLVDSDRDGLPDDWERTHFASLEQDAFDDFDADLRSNLSEFQGASNPADPESIPGYAESPWPAPRANGRRTGYTPYVGASSDDFVWVYCPDEGSAHGTAAIGPDGTVYLAAQCGGDVVRGLLSALTQEGELKWQYEARGQLDQSPSVGKDGTIYFGVAHGDSGTLHAVNPDGSKKWTAGFGDPGLMSSPAVGPDGVICFSTPGEEIWAFSSDGHLQWTFPYDDWADGELATGSDGIIYFGTRSGSLYAVNPDGTERWRFQANGEIRHSPAIGLDDTLYFGTEDGWLYALDREGSVVWSTEHVSAVSTSPAIGPDGTVFYLSGEELFARRSDGYLRWTTKHSSSLSDPTVDALGRIYLASPWNVVIVSPDGQSKTYLQYGGYGGVAVAADGSLFTVGETMAAILNREDTDKDGLPDAWETKHFKDLGQDATSDPDDDSVTNIEEYRTRTDPTVPEYGRWFAMLLISGWGDYSPCVTTDRAGNTIMAYVGGGLSRGIYVLRWDGETWSYLGADPSHGGGIAAGSMIDHPCLTVDEFGNPILAWQQEVGFGGAKNIFVLKWNGQKWVPIGNSTGTYGISGSTEDHCTNPVIITDLFGRPTVVWLRSNSRSNEYTLRVKRWTGAEWAEIGVWDVSPGAGTYGERNYDVVSDYQGRPVVVWVDDYSSAVMATRWNGENWESIGSRVSSGGLVGGEPSAIAPRVALSPSGNPAVTWLQKTTDPERESREAHLRIWNGTAWSPLGNSASGAGVSNTDKVCNAMLGFRASGYPFVAWLCQRTVLAQERPVVYARAWDGADWVEMGTGSTSFQGIGCPVRDDPSPALAMTAVGEAYLVYKGAAEIPGPEGIVLRKFTVNPDQKIRVATPEGFQKEDVTLRFTLANSLSVPMNAMVEFSLDGGAHWSNATPAQASKGLANLASSPDGVEHTFVWDSASDVDQNLRNVVRLRVTATSGSTHAMGTTSSFFLGSVEDTDVDLLDDEWEMTYFGSLAYDRKSDPDFDRCPNILEQSLGTDPTNPSQPARTPIASAFTPMEPQHGDVSISYTLVDYNADVVSIKVYYSEDGQNWYRATPEAGGDGTTDLTSSRQGIQHTFLWDSAADIRHTRQEGVRIRITPLDAEQGTSGTTVPFVVDNTSPTIQPCVIPAAEDAAVKAQLPDANFAGAGLGVGNLTSSEQRTYLRFDFSGLPQGVASGCELRMDVRSLLHFSREVKGTIRVRRAGAPWQQETITWNNQPPVGSPAIAELSLAEQPLDPLEVKEDVVFSWRSESLDALVNSWLNGVTNEGLVVEIDVEASSGPTEAVFYSSESAVSNSAVSPPRLLFDLDPYPDGPKPTIFLSRCGLPSTDRLSDNNELRVEVLSFRVEANDMEPVTVDSVEFLLSGTMNPPEDIRSMSLFVDPNGNGLYDGALVDRFLGTTTSLTSDRVTFGPLTEPIAPGQKEDWLLVADFSGKAAKGDSVTVRLALNESVAGGGSNSALPANVIIEPAIEGTCEIVSTSFKPGEFLVDDRRDEAWWLFKGFFDGEVEEFAAIPTSGRNIDPVGIEQDQAGNVHVCMGRQVYEFSPTGNFVGEVYSLPVDLYAMGTFVMDHEDNYYFSANDNELYRARAGEKEVRVPTGNIGFDTIVALAVNEQNELSIADLWTGQDFSSNIYRFSNTGGVELYVEALHEQTGAPYYVRSMTFDAQGRLCILVQGYGGNYEERIYSVEEDPAYPGDPGHRVFAILKSRPPTYPNLAWIAPEVDAGGVTGDLFVRQNQSRGQDKWALGLLNVTHPQEPGFVSEGFSSSGRRFVFAKREPLKEDRDGDGMPDAFEDFNGNGVFEPELFETSPDDSSDASVDFDGDGMSHLEEYLAGTDPTLHSSKLAVGSVLWEAFGTVTLSWDTVPGRRYQVYYSDDPLSFETTWTACGEPIVATGTKLSFMDVGDASVQRWHPLSFEVRYRYYRVSLLH